MDGQPSDKLEGAGQAGGEDSAAGEPRKMWPEEGCCCGAAAGKYNMLIGVELQERKLKS